MLTDTHCHLNLSQYDPDRDAVIKGARAAGLVRMLIPAIDLATSESAVGLAGETAEIYAAVGFHPNNLGEWGREAEDRIRTLAGREKVVAIGEIGLDYYWDTHPHELQREGLTAQLDLAAEMGLPVVIHNREATADVLDILLDWTAGMASSGNPLAGRPGVLHSFSGDSRDAERAISANFMLGVTGPVTFKNSLDLQALVTDLPLDRLLIETDAPYLTPHPHRGKRNEPALARLVAEKLAELKGLPVEEVLRATFENSVRLFEW
jgi:TatD DNase family protein